MTRKQIFLKQTNKQTKKPENQNPGTCICWASTLPLSQISTSKISFKVKISSLFCVHICACIWVQQCCGVNVKSEDTVWELILLSTTGILELELGSSVLAADTFIHCALHWPCVRYFCQSNGELPSTKAKCLDVYFQLYTSGGGGGE